MTMSEHLQPVQSSHYATIASWLDSAASTQRWAGPGVAFPLAPDCLAHALELEVRPGWVLLDAHDNCLGFGQYWRTEADTAHLGRIIVSPQARGRGLGRVLMQSLSRQALQVDGVRRLTLRVYRDNVAAMALYRNFGFVAVEQESTAQLLFMACPAG